MSHLGKPYLVLAYNTHNFARSESFELFPNIFTQTQDI